MEEDTATITQVRANGKKAQKQLQKPSTSLVLDTEAEEKPTKHTSLCEWSLTMPGVKSEGKHTKALHTWDVHQGSLQPE